MKRLISLLVAGIVLGTPLLTIQSAFAAASMSLSASKSVGKGATLSVSIYENSGGEAVNAAKATLSYPANLLDFVSIGSSSAFAVVAANSGGGGTVNVDRGALPAVSGRQLVATVRFKAKADAGSAAINITGGSVLNTSSTDVLTGKAGVTVTLTPPVVAAAPPPKDTTPPTITNVKIANVTYNSATVTWTTSEPATSVVEYGFTTSYGVTAADANLVTEHKITLNPNVLTPVSKVHLIAKSADAAGNAVSDKDMSFTTKGLTFTVTVLDQKKKPVANAKVTLEGKTVTTDSKGKATFTNLRTGTISGSVDYKGKQTGITIRVNEVGAAVKVDTQVATLNIKVQKTSSVIFIPLLVLLLIAGAVIWLIRTGKDQTLLSKVQGKFPKKKDDNDGGPKPPTPPEGSGTAVVEGASEGVTGITTPPKSNSESTTVGTVVQPTKSPDDPTETL